MKQIENKELTTIIRNGSAKLHDAIIPLIFVAMFIVLAQFVSSAASASVAIGDKAMKAERYRAAITQYEAYLKDNPNDGIVMIKAARAYEGALWWGQAVQWWEKYLDKFPKGRQAASAKRHAADCHRWLGANYYITGGSYRSSIKELNMAVTLDPKLADAYVWLATIYQNEGMYDETVAALDKGLAAVPHDEILLVMRKDADSYRKADAKAYASHRKGIALYESGDKDGALGMFREASEDSANFAAAHLWIGRILFEQGKFADSIPEWQAAIRIRPDNEHAIFYLQLARSNVAAGK